MSLSHNSHFIHFLKNKEMNLLYLAIFFITLGDALISVFVPIYLYQLGYQVTQILYFYLLVSIFFVTFSILGAKITSRFGEKHSMIISTPFAILFYIGLIFMNSKSFLLFYFLPLFMAFRALLFNYGFHLNFINHSNKNKTGNQFAFIQTIALLSTVVSPYIGSLIAELNFAFLFIISAIIMTIGIIPLLLTQDKCEKIDFDSNSIFKTIKSKKNRGNIISFCAYSMEASIGRIIWPIFLIIIIGELSKTGFIVSASMFISLMAFYVIGKITDKINKIKLIRFGTLLYFFGWIGRIFANTGFKIFFIDSYKNLSEKLVSIPFFSHSYDMAKKRKKYFEFVVYREIVFNLIRIIMIPILIVIFYINFQPFILSFLIASIFTAGYIFMD